MPLPVDLSHLNAPQREAVLTTEGPVLVLAGAGSGKTRVITHRIAHLLERGVPPRAILAVTFTNKAADEMRDRVVELAGQRALGVTLSTFHAFGAEVLREHLVKLGWPRRFAIVDTGDQVALIRRAMRELGLEEQAFDARKILTVISRAKSSGLSLSRAPAGALEALGATGGVRLDDGDEIDLDDDDDLELGDDGGDGLGGEVPADPHEYVAAEVFPLYQLALKAQGAVDFDDLIVFPSQIFEQFPDVKAALVRRFRYVMVDEYQDTNRAQLELLRHLAGERRNVCVVGDDDQCIYSWRGAEVRNILDFERSFPGGRAIRLEENYRSSETILEAANAVVARVPERREKRMWTRRTGGQKLSVVAAPSEEDEARYVAQEIQRALAEGHAADDIAVLYRTNGQARPFEESLRERGVRYHVVGGSEFFDRREVKDVVAYLKVLANPKDEISLLRIVNVPARGIGDATVERVTAWALADGRTLWEALTRAHEAPGIGTVAAERLAAFVALVERYRERLRAGRLSAVARELLEEIAFLDAVRAQAPSMAAGARKVQSVLHLLGSLERFEQREGPKASLLVYLNRLALDDRDEADAAEPLAGRVSLMTLHAAKGLEWRLVFLVGLEEGLLPHGGMQGEPANPAEERRLCYVGMTRAREALVLTRAAARVKRGRAVPRTPSRFLDDLPDELCEHLDLGAAPEGPPTARELSFFEDLRARLRTGTAGSTASGAGASAQVPLTRP